MITGVKKVQLNLDMGNNKERARQQMMAQMEDSLDKREETKFAEGQLSARILGRLEEHADQYSMPRSRLPKMDQTGMDRYAAARRNVLLLGALAETSKKKTAKPKAAPDSAPAATPPEVAPQADDGTVVTDDLSLGLPTTNFTSFKSQLTEGGASTIGSSTTCPVRRPFGRSESRMSRVAVSEAGQSDVAAGSDAASVHELRRSPSIITSDVNSPVAPIPAARRMRTQLSRLSMQSNTRTDRSALTTTTSARTIGRRKKGPPKQRLGRITLAFQRWGSQDDWVSKVLLRHALASVIQARWRGYILRKRMAEDRTTALEMEHSRLHADELRHKRLAELRQQVDDYRRKQAAKQEEAEHNAATAAAAAAAAAAAYEASQSGEPYASGVMVGGGSSTTLCASCGSSSSVFGAASAATAVTMRTPNFTSSYTMGGSDSDSGWSDVELEQMADIKYRARTPPWQAVEEGQAQGRQRRLVGGRPGGGAMSSWQAAQAGHTGDRLEELRHRRILRPPLAVALSQPASAAAEASGILPCAPSNYAVIVHGPGAAELEDADAVDSSSIPLPADVISGIMETVVQQKMQRLGLAAGMRMPHFRPKR